MNWKLAVPSFAVLYLSFLVLGLPAARVVELMDARPEQLSFQPLQGSWLVGESEQVWLGTLSLGKVRWRLKPVALILGCLEYQVQFETSIIQKGTGRLGSCLGSRTYVEHFRATVPARELGILASNGLLAIGGQVELDVASLRGGDEIFKEAEGVVQWKAAAIDGQNRLHLGSVTINLDLQDGTLIGRVSNRGGEVGLGGNLAYGQEGRYELNLRIGAQGGKQPPSWIGAVARRQGDGSYLLRHSGQL